MPPYILLFSYSWEYGKRFGKIIFFRPSFPKVNIKVQSQIRRAKIDKINLSAFRLCERYFWS